MKKLIGTLLVLQFIGCAVQKNEESKQNIIVHVTNQLEYGVSLADGLRDSINIYPRTIEDGKLRLVRGRDWTSGFFGGNLWMAYELTGEEKWLTKALEYTLPLEDEKWDGGTHDLGFKMFNSFGKAYINTGNEYFKEVIIQSANTLATRFNPTVGCIRSWDHNADKWDFPVIIDNMMNLEMMMWAAKESGIDSLREIAILHAQTTAKNHFREDNSTWHVIDYNPETGEVENRNTHQGYSDDSSWSRGQAWGLYGYTMMYRETQMEEFLVQAEKIATFVLSQPGVSEGKIPYWDFDAPNIPDEPYDASAAAIMVAAFYELGLYAKNGERYIEVADKLFETLSSPEFLAPVGENMGFLLEHSTGHLPHNSEIDVPLVYADYYFLESIIKRKNMEKN